MYFFLSDHLCLDTLQTLVITHVTKIIAANFLQDFANPDTAITIITKDIKYQDIIGKAPDASFRDIKLANLMYKCDGKYHFCFASFRFII